MIRLSFGRSRAARPPRLASDAAVALRLSEPAEDRALARLAELAEQPLPAGPTLVAEVDGEAWAALPLRGGRPLADPFRPSRELVALLVTRAAQLLGPGPPKPRQYPPAAPLRYGSRCL